jgi:hypothetical protein
MSKIHVLRLDYVLKYFAFAMIVHINFKKKLYYLHEHVLT